MRKIILLMLVVTLSNLTYSQNQETEPISTTIDEYNYMTKGYKMQQTSGLDMKKGYNIENIKTLLRGNYSFSFKALIRTEENQLAGILIIGHSDVSGRDYYLGMPINNRQLQLEFERDIRNWDESMTTAYAQTVSELFSNNTLNSYLVAKKTN